MPGLSAADASEDEADGFFAGGRADELMSYLTAFLSERSSYKPRHEDQKLWRSARPVTAFTNRYGLYSRMLMAGTVSAILECQWATKAIAL